MPRPAVPPGRLLERIGDDAPRGMTAHDRTRLIGRLRHLSPGPGARTLAAPRPRGPAAPRPRGPAASGAATTVDTGGRRGRGWQVSPRRRTRTSCRGDP